MSLSFLALVLITCPQTPEPGVAEVLRPILAEQDATKAVEAVVAELRSIGNPDLRAIESPSLVAALREAGPGAVDLFADRTEPLGVELSPADLIQFVAGQWSRRVPKIRAKAVDLNEFEKLCERLQRDVVKAVGSGREVDTTAARLHAILDHLRLPGSGVDWDRATRQLIEERVERVGRVDLDELLVLARRLTAASLLLNDAKLIERMRRDEVKRPHDSVKGDVLEDRQTSFGRFVVGGFGANEYDCSQIDVIVDFGGDDIYRGPAGGTGELRRFAAVIDLSGNDRYQALNSGLGSGTYGIGLLLDCAGDDVYRGSERCLGFGAAGVGVWLDLDGDDDVEVGALGAGLGLAGIGVAGDFGGDDKHVAGTESFGCGLPGGLGVFFDRSGNDQRSVGSRTIELHGRSDSVSMGFGVGVGASHRLSAGVGLFVDAAGADVYEAVGLALGAGVRDGCGVFRDRDGDDRYQAGFAALGATFDSGVGVAIDDAGSDSFIAGSLSLGAAIGGGCAVFCDRAGDDSYRTAAVTLGSARRAAFAAFVDLGGSDAYTVHDEEFGWSAPEEKVGDAIAICLDAGGAQDKYPEGGSLRDAEVQVIESDHAGGRERRILVDR